MEHPIKMDDLGGKPTIFGNTHINILILPIGADIKSSKALRFVTLAAAVAEREGPVDAPPQ